MKKNDFDVNPLRKFYVAHPKFRRVIDFLDGCANFIINMCYFMLAFLIVVTMIFMYLLLPDDINTPASAITGGFLSLIIFPLMKEVIKHRVQIQNEQFKRSYTFYTELSKLIINSIKSQTEISVKRLAQFIEDNYSENCVSIPTKISNCIYYLYDECLMFVSKEPNVRSNSKSFQYFSRRCIRLIRRQGNITGMFFFDKRCCCDERIEVYTLERIE